MSKQALGADINEFYNNILPDDCTVDDMADYISDDDNVWTSDNKLSLYAAELYDLDDLGTIQYADGKVVDFPAAFLEWKEKLNTAKLLVTVPKEWAGDVKRGIEYTFSDVVSVEEV